MSGCSAKYDGFRSDTPDYQLAGDLLPVADRGRRDEQLTATGFLVVGPKMLFDRDPLGRLDGRPLLSMVYP
jgi:hypothetical protein